MLPINIIEQKFLVPGHTQMERDPMHLAIKRAKKNVSIFVPNQWILLMANAHRSRPYIVNEMNNASFFGFTAADQRRYRENVNWLKMKIICYKKAKPNIIAFKYM